MLEWHIAHGRNVSLTARRFLVSRPTVYRWLARDDPQRLTTLEDRSSAPRRRRRRTWTCAQIEAVRELREQYPRWSKTKIAILLRRDSGLRISASTVGRILTYLRRRGVLPEPARSRRPRRRPSPRPYAVRLPRGYRVERPGDLVEIDTVEIRLPGITRPYRQFTARDRVSRHDVLELRRTATARAAASVLEAIVARMPFEVRAISVDGGSEFMADFEAACAERKIRLFVLPPRSPKLHAAVESANATHLAEFYEVTDAGPDVGSLAAALADWEICSNTVRPHQALGYLTPREWLVANGYLAAEV
jgi:transposase InsO family protein